MPYVVVGLTDDCDEYQDHDCVSWAHGPFDHHKDAAEHAGLVPARFRPHVIMLDPGL
jgi:hypothetical protein